MKEMLAALDKALQDGATRKKYIEFAQGLAQWHGKTPLGRKFTITRSSLIAAAYFCGETAVEKFFDGDDLSCKGRKVSEWLADCEKVEVK